MKKTYLCLLISTASLLTAFTATAADVNSTSSPSMPTVKQCNNMHCSMMSVPCKLTKHDVAFADEAALGGMLEVKLGQVATTHAQTVAIK